MPIRRSTRRKRVNRGRRRIATIGALALLGAVVYLIWPFWQIAATLGTREVQQPSRLYARATQLRVGSAATTEGISKDLKAAGYQRVTAAELLPGRYRSSPTGFEIYLREFPTAKGWSRPGLLAIRLGRRQVESLAWQGRPTERAILEPPILFTFYGSDLQERRPVDLSALPKHFVDAVLAAEDAGFYSHAGLSLTGMARAAWVNARGGELRQGGSTVTQQLVKNLFLTHERTIVRKVREAVLAILIEWRYEKRTILNAYLNEIYWGKSGRANLMGVGAASWAYFGVSPEALSLCQSAVLAGMIRSPGSYSPTARPQKVLARRNWVLGRMRELKSLDPAEAEAALDEPLCSSPHSVDIQRASYFVDAVRKEAGSRFGVQRLGGAGLALLSTLELSDQQQADKVVESGLIELESKWERRRRVGQGLQAALVSIDPRSGEILAYIGGRDYAASQFDRAGSALRQAGSAFKPIVYAAAFEDRIVSPASLLEDAPLTVKTGERSWSPSNSDSKFRGWVTARTALESSLNVPTARLALMVGLSRVIEIAKSLGISSPLRPVPALALGAFEVSPIELATAYATFANGGVRPPVHGLSAVLDANGAPLSGRDLPRPRRVLSPQTNYLITSILQGVLERGTGRSARYYGVVDSLAGKTGTSNDRRDSWFAGFSAERITLVWVGYDDSSSSRLSGARAGLPIWSRFTVAVRPAGGFSIARQPRGVVTAVIDPLSGELATDSCPSVLTEVFLEGTVPREICYLHGKWPSVRESDPRWVELKQRRRPWGWVRRIFKKRDRSN